MAYTTDIVFLQINDNGVISLDSPYNVRTPLSLPLTGTDKIIAPYWADVDIRRTGNIYYRQTTNPSLLARATSEIRAALPASQNVTITNLLIATWDKVGYYYRNTDKVCVRKTQYYYYHSLFILCSTGTFTAVHAYIVY